ncbi:MAG: S8 family serine peptidase, partial [Anaerolineae bacterium]
RLIPWRSPSSFPTPKQPPSVPPSDGGPSSKGDRTAENIELLGVPALWELGLTGEGIVVATMDTGVDETHPDLAERWRGGSSSWFDPYGEHPTDPTDLNGHGTWVTGIMVAGDKSGTTLGVAPDARWIGVKIFPDRASPTRSAIHAGYQWLLDPDGDPTTADAPHVVVNAWSIAAVECDLEFQPDLSALRAIGILPVFAAGNYGPTEDTDVSPANNPAAFAVGATDNDDQIYLYSSRGPSTCGEQEATIYPEIVAPGVDITTTGRSASYITESGTSFAAPHVAGALALLLSAYPELSAEKQAALLTAKARDLGEPGADDVFGYGRLDAHAAYVAYEPPPIWNDFLPLVVRRYPHRLFLPLVHR